MYLTPQKPHQLSLFTDTSEWRVEHVDAVYMTRPQTERYQVSETQKEAQRDYLRIEKGSMAADSLRDAVVMHPLPRRDEIAPDMDDDPRSIYFKQTARGVPIRMAILAWLLGRLPDAPPPEARPEVHHRLRSGPNPCPNPSCISRTEPRHVPPTFTVMARVPLRARCGYCTRELPFRFVGCASTRNYHLPEAHAVRQILPANLVFFADRAQAEDSGFHATQSVLA